MKRTYLFLIVIITIFLIPSASAHVPISSGDNDSIERALHVHEPTKSWAIYDEISELGQAKYYRFTLKEGDRLRISLYTPEEGKFSPNCVIMASNIESKGTIPDYVEVPEGYNFEVLEGKRSGEAEYEPFTPASYYYTVDYDEEVNATGTYYIAVYEPNNTGKFGIAIGYVEKFDIDEWLLVPIDVINIRVWEGQSLAVIFAPMMIILIFGMGIMIWKIKNIGKFNFINPPKTTFAWLVYLSSLIYVGSGFMVLHQMSIALSRSAVGASVVVTLIFAAIPIILGYAILNVALKEEKPMEKRDIIKLFLFGILGLIFWAGLIVGPVLVIGMCIVSLYILISYKK
ncbi:MAG: hypothetical protein JSW00_16610 [Thermoplasmata archaeon]|nr:MAG: hypothetical protein JSW00_16610 [Thermoplasmata archaeon]